jgi:hypothetical protein
MITIKTGTRVQIRHNIYTVDGLLEEGTIVKIEEVGFPDKDLRVTDPVGKIWYIDELDVKDYGQRTKKDSRPGS